MENIEKKSKIREVIAMMERWKKHEGMDGGFPAILAETCPEDWHSGERVCY